MGQDAAGAHPARGCAVVQPVPQLLWMPEQQRGLRAGDLLFAKQLAGLGDGLSDRGGVDPEQFGQDLCEQTCRR
jgi:hypothetical protein